MKHTLHLVLLTACVGLATGATAGLQDPSSKDNLNERLEATKIVWEKLSRRPVETVSDMDTRALWSCRLAEASIAAGSVTAREALGEHLKRMEARLKVMESLVQDDRAGEYDLAFVRYHVLDAKRLLAQATTK